MADSYLAAIGTNDASGPWVANVAFISDSDLNIYWISMTDRRHSEAIAMYKKTAVAITASWEKGKERALQIEGEALQIDAPSLKVVQDYCRKTGKKMPKTATEEITPKHFWYKLTPSYIGLMYSEKFGWDRKSVL